MAAFDVEILSGFVVEMTKGIKSLEAITSGGGSAPDIIPPTITNINPPADTTIANGTPITFDVTDVSPGLSLVVIHVKFSNDPSTVVAYDGTNFKYPFAGTSSVTGDALAGFSFSLLTFDGRWPGSIELSAIAIDSDGNIT